MMFIMFIYTNRTARSDKNKHHCTKNDVYFNPYDVYISNTPTLSKIAVASDASE